MPALNQKTVFLSALAIGCTLSFMAGKIYFGPSGSGPSQGAHKHAHSAGKLQGRQSPRSSQAAAHAQAGRHGAAQGSSFTGSPIERLASIHRIEDLIERSEAILELANQLSPSQLEEAIAHLQAEDVSLDSRSIHYPLLDAWVRVDPQAALNHARDHISHQSTRKMLISAWALADPIEALSWAREQDAISKQYPWTAGVASTLAGKNLDMATDIVTSMPNSGSRTVALYALLMESMKQGEEAAREWITSIKDEELRTKALRMLALNQPKKS